MTEAFATEREEVVTARSGGDRAKRADTMNVIKGVLAEEMAIWGIRASPVGSDDVFLSPLSERNKSTETEVMHPDKARHLKALGRVGIMRPMETVKLRHEVESVSRLLNLPKEEIIHNGVHSLLEKEYRVAQEDLSEIRERYRAATRKELESKIKNKKIPSHPAWEDLIRWENLEQYLRQISKALQGA